MSRIIAFANHKGGVSKTTSVANVGAILSRKGKKVLLIDLDAQANLTDYFLKDKPEETVFSGFMLPKTTVIKINKYLGSDRSDAISDFVTVIQLDDGIIFMRTVVLYNYMINQGPDFLKLTIMESINRFSGGLKGVLS